MPCFVICPHCKAAVEIAAVNCGIFRHGVYKSNGKQLPPHMPKAKCDALVRAGALYGCGKPFKYVGTGPAVPCGYI
jgi:hypothetical protein